MRRRPSFTHASRGTSAAAWAATVDEVRPRALRLPANSRLVVVAAHPDDETLGAGGLLAAASDAGWPIAVVVLSDRARSHPRSPTHSPELLAELRAREVVHAVEVLAPGAQVVRAGLPDGGLAQVHDESAGVIRSVAEALPGTGRPGSPRPGGTTDIPTTRRRRWPQPPWVRACSSTRSGPTTGVSRERTLAGDVVARPRVAPRAAAVARAQAAGDGGPCDAGASAVGRPGRRGAPRARAARALRAAVRALRRRARPALRKPDGNAAPLDSPPCLPCPVTRSPTWPASRASR